MIGGDLDWLKSRGSGVAYLGGRWAMVPFGKKISFGHGKKLGKPGFAPPPCVSISV